MLYERRMEGFGGCNRVAARTVQDTVGARSIAIGRIERGTRGCDASAQNAEARVLEILQSVSSYNIIIDAFKGRVYEMSVHSFGCRVIQRMLEHCKEEQIRPILVEVFKQVLDLTKD